MLRVLTVECLLVSFAVGFAVNNQTRTKRQSCQRRQFPCRNGACIDDVLICNGAFDCPDNSDETLELCIKSIICPSYAFRCDYGACLVAEAKCNGKIDCADGSDERGCPGAGVVGVKCGTAEFQCKSGQCIDILLQCDGNKDCKDGSDETRDACCFFSCPGFAFKCADGECIDRDGRCNGIKECADGTDESPDICQQTQRPPVYQRPSRLTERPKPSTTTSTTPQPPAGHCILPQAPENGEYIVGNCEGDSCSRPGTRLPFAVLNYTCDPGYTIRGTQTTFCAQGTWYGQPPTCSIEATEKLPKAVTTLPTQEPLSPGTSEVLPVTVTTLAKPDPASLGYVNYPGYGWYKSYDNPNHANWFAARDRCRRDGADLAVPDSVGEKDNVFRKLAEALSYALWIGVYAPFRNGTWITVHGDPVPSDWWEPGQPRREKYCGRLEGRGVYSIDCWFKASFICELHL